MGKKSNKPDGILLCTIDDTEVYLTACGKDNTFGLIQKPKSKLVDVQAPAVTKDLQNIVGEEKLDESKIKDG